MQHPENTWNATDWLSLGEGKLSVDVVETQTEIFVRTAIAGVRVEDLEINLSDDTLTIRGKREHGCDEQKVSQVHVQECHWGIFSRTIILPVEVDARSIEAVLKRGILTIKMKKIEIDRKVPILEIDDL